MQERMSDGLIRAAGITGYSDLVAELGGDPRARLAEVGLSPAMLCQQDRYLSYGAVVELLESTAASLACPSFGLRLGARQSLAILGPLALALSEVSSLGEGYTQLAAQLGFHSPNIAVVAEPCDGDHYRVRFALERVKTPSQPQLVEHAIALCAQLAPLLVGDLATPVAVTFRHSAQGQLAFYTDYFGVTPQFGQPFDSIVLPAELMLQPLALPNSGLLALIERYLAPYLVAPNTTSERVVAVIAQLLNSQHVDLGLVARALAVHPRTLQRHLKNEHNSFAKLLDEARQQQARGYLAEQRLPLAHVAELLGYADQAVLTRSCQRWFGCSPGQLRRASRVGSQALFQSGSVAG